MQNSSVLIWLQIYLICNLIWLQKQDDDEDKFWTAAGRELQAVGLQRAEMAIKRLTNWPICTSLNRPRGTQETTLTAAGRAGRGRKPIESTLKYLTLLSRVFPGTIRLRQQLVPISYPIARMCYEFLRESYEPMRWCENHNEQGCLYVHWGLKPCPHWRL